MEGRILFYNDQTGEGKIILQNKEKANFSVELWEDFENTPKAGMLLECEIIDGKLISAKASSISRESKAKISENGSSSIGGEGQATFSVEETLKRYFAPIEFLIGEPPEIVNTKHQLEYFLSRRFLMTAYNNLRGIDPSLYKNEDIQKVEEDLKQLHKAYMTIEEKVAIPKLAFEVIFLRSQPEYLQFIKHKEHCTSRISLLTQIEESLFPDIQEKEKILREMKKNDSRREGLESELRKMRGHYVDAIHENANLSEELVTMEDIKKTYTKKYSYNFSILLQQEGKHYLNVLKKILNYRAYSFDNLIWKGTEKSKAVREYFIQGNIEGEYSTITYLKYYLKTLDKDKLNDEQRDLFKLLEYLEKQK